VDQLCREAGAAPTVLGRPTDGGVTGVDERRVPGPARGPRRVAVVARRSDRRGDLISGGGRIPFAPLLLNISQQANFVPEGGQSLVTAQQEALQRLAEQIVGQMERDVLANCPSPAAPPYYETER